jgi:hypothetical protein
MSEHQTRSTTFLRKRRERVKEAKKRVITMSRQPSISFAKMAKDLTEVHFHATAKEFREVAINAGMSVRKAYQLVRIHKALENHWNDARFEQIGWTSLCVIAANVAEGAPVEQWLKFAETHTARQCQLRLANKPFKNETRCMLLRFDDNQYKAFSKAVLQLGAKQRGRGLVGVERALLIAPSRGRLSRSDRS